MIRFFTPLRLALLVALAATTLAGFIIVPPGAQLPIHWGLSGAPDAFAPRDLALLLPAAVVVLVWSVFLLVARTAGPGDLAAGRYVTSVSLTALTGVFLLLEVLFVLIGTGAPVNVLQALALAFGVLLLVLGNAMPKSQPNSFAGIRMPSTLRDPANWQATHRLGGVLTIAGGLVLLAAAILAPRDQLAIWLIACVSMPPLAAIAYSLLLARRRGQ
jgi:uncharacterized membrane protein